MPWYYFGKPPDGGEHVSVRVLSANLRLGRADVPSFVDLARAGADVITLSEMTPDWLRRFYATGIRTEFRYSVPVPAVGAGGFGLWSRFPLEVVTPMRGGSMIAARVQIPGVRVDPVSASVHITNPLAFYGRAFDQWRTGITAAQERMAGLAEAAGPGSVIVAGDFNSTPDMQQFCDLLNNGYRDAVEQTGADFAPTFPSRPVFPPLITIDHLLTRNASASSIRTIDLRGSDDRALLRRSRRVARSRLATGMTRTSGASADANRRVNVTRQRHGVFRRHSPGKLHGTETKPLAICSPALLRDLPQ